MKKVKKRRYNPKFVLRKYTGHLNAFLMAVVILLILSSGYYFMFKTDFFIIKGTNVSGTQTFVNEQDLQNLVISNAHGKNLVTYDSGYLKDVLAKNFLGAKQIYVKKSFPDKLKIEVKERLPIAVVVTRAPVEHYLVDEDGFVLGIVNPEGVGLPKLTYEGDVKVGLFINKDLVPVYLSLTRLLEEQDVQVSSISFNQGVVNFYTSDGAQVLMGFDKIKKDTVFALSQIITQEKIDGKIIKRVDLRYDKVIVSFN